MSRDGMVWRPTPTDPPPRGIVPDTLAHLLNKWLHDGESPKATRQEPDRIEADHYVAGFLAGLAAAGVEGAAELAQNLQNHTQLDLWWE